ncbi:hypothetical protein Glove_490g51 [Diversispora epigaea]|uniref:Uncharacterized protein n=1 Tax=Diversispora epigaea TaxID=1348612 RepID=A0A397GK45_9GLOM|nr:hypothetical protein Glove_490g51 [Diversispora epigaea]
MALTEHEAPVVLALLQEYFRVPNNDAIRDPIKTIGHEKKCHQTLRVLLMFHDLSWPFSSDANGFFTQELWLANIQDINSWRTRCETWMYEFHAQLWTRQYPASAGFVAVTNPDLSGVSSKIWDFGTLLHNTTTPTTCIGPGIPAYQVTIPVESVFWNPR